MSEAEKPTISASTVLLIRDGANGLEVFMVVRHHEIDSFSGALVFPAARSIPRMPTPGLIAAAPMAWTRRH